MNVKELREFLAQFPDDLEILYCCCSDYARMEATDIGITKAVDKGGYWMRPHYSMSQENKDNQKDYLLFPGN